jgi:hypothetical protein
MDALLRPSDPGVIRDQAFQDQMDRASYLVIVMTAIISWNTISRTKPAAPPKYPGWNKEEAHITAHSNAKAAR